MEVPAAGCPSSRSLATLVSESDLIVVADPDVHADRIKAEMLKDSPDYVEIPLLINFTVKGDEDDLTLRFYPERTDYAPSPDALIGRDHQPTLFFLTRVDQGPVGVYLTHSIEALQEPSAAKVVGVKAEVSRQDSINRNWKEDRSLPHFDEVHDLLEELPRASSARQAAIFKGLERLDSNGVPAIIAQMDDRRPLVDPHISLINNFPDAFEGMRHYGPELFVDALDAILNQITGFGGSITNGGSERERRNAVAAWRVYASDLKCS